MVFGKKKKDTVVKKIDKTYLRVFSRHPSHTCIRHTIKIPKGKKGVLRLGSLNSPLYPVDLEINSVESIENTMNKLRMKQLFEKNGVHSPKFYEIEDIDKLKSEISFPVLAKRTFRSRGIGMKKIDTMEEFEQFLKTSIINNSYNKKNPYYLEIFKNYVREYRIHVSIAGGYFYSCRKMLKNSATQQENNWYRNDSNSVWVREENSLFNKPETWDDIIKDCQLARESLGLDICALDVKVNKAGNWLILEANSAPSFGSVTSEKYKSELQKIIHGY